MEFIITRCHYAWPDGRRAIEIAVGVEAVSPAALARLSTAAGTPCYPQEWSWHTTPLAAVQAAIRLQTALRHGGHGYWPLRISGADLPAHAALHPRRARRWAVRSGRPPARQAPPAMIASPTPSALTYVFVGERPSPRAVALGATWQNGKLAGHTLRQTLLALDIDPDRQIYLNLWSGAVAGPDDPATEAAAIGQVQRLHRQGYVVVGLGRRVSQRLTTQGLPHRLLVHPAARGAIRRRDRYQAHARQVLLPPAAT